MTAKQMALVLKYHGNIGYNFVVPNFASSNPHPSPPPPPDTASNEEGPEMARGWETGADLPDFQHLHPRISIGQLLQAVQHPHVKHLGRRGNREHALAPNDRSAVIRIRQHPRRNASCNTRRPALPAICGTAKGSRGTKYLLQFQSGIAFLCPELMSLRDNDMALPCTCDGEGASSVRRVSNTPAIA